MEINSETIKKIILKVIPIAMPFYFGDKFSEIWRCLPQTQNTAVKIMDFINHFTDFMNNPMLSFYPNDLFIGVIAAAAFNGYLYYRKKNAKKYRKGKEYGDAAWGKPEDIKPYMDTKNLAQSQNKTDFIPKLEV